MRYCNYDYYVEEFAGSMPQTLFNRLSIIATNKIKANTFNRIDENDVPVDVKNCMCALADEIKHLDKQKGKKSESVGSWNVSYDNDRLDDSLLTIMKEYIPEYLYRGI